MARGADRHPSGPTTRDPRSVVIEMARQGRSVRSIMRFVNRASKRSHRVTEAKVRAWTSRGRAPAS